MKKVTDIVAEIAAASQEQSSGIDQVNKAVMQMDEMTQQNAALVEEAAAASRSMEEQAHKMVELMGFFKTGAAPSSVTGSSAATNEHRGSGGRVGAASGTKAKAQPRDHDDHHGKQAGGYRGNGQHAPVAKPSRGAPRADAGGDQWQEF